MYLVKYWTLLIEIFAIVAWIYFLGSEEVDEGRVATDILRLYAYYASLLWKACVPMIEQAI